jgi:hypothetical protein
LTGSPTTVSLVEGGLEQALLHEAVDGRDQNDEAGVERLRGIELSEVARIVGDEDKVPSRA